MSFPSRFLARIRKTAVEIVDYSEPNTPFIGLVGLAGYPFLYFILQYQFPQSYNNFIPYFIGILFILPQVFYRFMPAKLKQYYTLYFFMGGFYTLPFFSTFMLLKNECAIVWVLATLGCLLFLIIIFYDWLIITLMTVTAYGLAYILVLLSDGRVRYTQMEWSYLPVFVICYVGAISLNHRKQMSHEAKISLMKSLSGTIAHEMRNPLNSITFAMETVQSTLPVKPGVDSKLRNFVLSYDDLLRIHNVIGESIDIVRSGNRMIDSILSNLREGEIDKKYFRRYPVRNVIMAALNTYSHRSLDEKAMIFTDFRDEYDFFGDKDQFIYVLINLIKNALYYSQKAGFRIDISTESTPSANIVRVRDTGPGIPAALRERVFKRFYTAGKQDGNGLGLSFCRRVIESFSGTITCDSVENSWTEFIITLPKYDSKTVESIKKQILATKAFLVVDDQGINRISHAKYLADLNCRVDQAENGRQALEMAAMNRYDMILMDIEMPVLNGDEAVKLIRSGFDMPPSMKLHYRDAAIVGVTALPREVAIRRTLHAGMNEFVLKPLNKGVLTRLFEKYFFDEQDVTETETQELLVGSTILVADDNDMSRKFISILLENEGSIITQAENGKQVLELLDTMDFDLVLMDMEMPVMGGMEATRLIRKGKCFKRFRQFGNIPVIAITGNNDQDTINQVMAVGMNAHIGKPVRKQDLIRTILFWLGQSRNHKPELFPASASSSDHEEATAGAFSDNSEIPANVLEQSVIDSIQNVGGDTLLSEFFEIFHKDVSKFINDLEIARTEDNLSLADMVSHALKGVAANIGAGKLYAYAEQINDTIREGHWPEESNWTNQLRLLHEEACSAFQCYFQAAE
jgi:two-component system, CAI-1 autoinducer sensor kinase/phosphatase CqsS